MNTEYRVEVQEETEAKEGADWLQTHCFDFFDTQNESTYRKESLERMKNSRREYEGVRDTKNFPWEGCSNYSMMVTALVVDDIAPRLAAQFSGRGKDVIQAEPVSSEYAQGVKDVEEFTEWALTENIKWDRFVSRLVMGVLLDPAVFVVPHYIEEEVKRKTRLVGEVLVDPISGEKIDPNDELRIRQMLIMGLSPRAEYRDELVDKDVTVFRVKNEILPFEDVFVPDIITDWETCPAAVRIRPTYQELERGSEANGGPYINITEKLIADEETSRTDDTPYDMDTKPVRPDQVYKEIPCIEFYMPSVALEEGDDPDWVIVTYTVNSKTCIRRQYLREAFMDNRKPLRRFMLMPDRDKAYGFVVYDKIKHHHLAVNDSVNQMIDAGTLQIMPYFIAGPNAGLRENQSIYPGAMLEASDPTAIKEVNHQLKAQVMIEFVNLIMGFVERLMSVSSYSDGVQDTAMGQGAGTAAGMKMLLNESQAKRNFQSKPVKDELEDLIADDIKLYGWFMPTDAEIRVSGEFKQANIDMLQGDYIFTMRISDSATNEMLERMEKAELFQMASSLPYVNQVEMFKELLEAYQVKQPEKYINPQFLIILQACAQNPKIVEAVQQVMQQQQQGNKMAEMQQQVNDTLMKRHIMDMAEAEKIKKQNPGMITEDDLKDGIRTAQKGKAKDLAEAILSPGINQG